MQEIVLLIFLILIMVGFSKLMKNIKKNKDVEYIKDWIKNNSRDDYSFRKSGIILIKMLLLIIKLLIIIILIYLIILFAFEYDVEHRIINEVNKELQKEEDEFYKKEMPKYKDYLDDKEN